MTSKITLEVPDGSTLTQNTDSNMVVLSEEKIENILLKYLGNLKKQSQWITPASLVLTIIITLVTTDFKDALLSASTWEAIFVLSLVIFIALLAWTLFVAFRFRSKTSVDYLKQQFYKSRTNKD